MMESKFVELAKLMLNDAQQLEGKATPFPVLTSDIIRGWVCKLQDLMQEAAHEERVLKQATPETAFAVVQAVTVSVNKYLTEVMAAQAAWREPQQY